jgi:hypothetical protein
MQALLKIEHNTPNQLRIWDYLPVSGPRTQIDIKLVLPNGYVFELADSSLWDEGAPEFISPYNINYPYLEPMVLSMQKMLDTGLLKDANGEQVTSISTNNFPDGLYDLDVSLTVDFEVYNFQEKFLMLYQVDSCLVDKIQEFLDQKSCECKGMKKRELLSKMIILKEGLSLDLKYERYAEMEYKLQTIYHLCDEPICKSACSC